MIRFEKKEEERRRQPRARRVHPVTLVKIRFGLFSGESIRARTLDVNPSGIRICYPRAGSLAEGDRIDLILSRGTDEPQTTIPGRVRWVRAGKFQSRPHEAVGVEFLRLSLDRRSRILAFFDLA